MAALSHATGSITSLVNRRIAWNGGNNLSAEEWHNTLGAPILQRMDRDSRLDLAPWINSFFAIHRDSGGKHWLEYKVGTDAIYAKIKSQIDAIQQRKNIGGGFVSGKTDRRQYSDFRHFFEVPLSLLNYFHLKTGINLAAASVDEYEELWNWSRSLNNQDDEAKMMFRACTVNTW